MLTRMAIVMCCIIWVGSNVLGENLITKWGGAGTGYGINQGTQTVTITAAGTYKFKATDGGGLGDINLIETDPNNTVSGIVNVYVQMDPNGGSGDGAANVDEINLSTATTSNIMLIDISTNLGDIGNIVATTISGPISVGGDIVHDIEITSLLGNISCDDMADLDVTGTGTHTGDIAIDANGNGTHSGNIEIDGTYDGDLFIDAVMEGVTTIGTLSGSMTVGQNLEGTVTIGSLPGRLQVNYSINEDVDINGNVTASGSIDAGAECTAPITIDGDMDGSLRLGHTTSRYVSSSIDITGDCTGPITIGGEMQDTSSINIDGMLAADAPITIYSLKGDININGTGTHAGDIDVNANGTCSGDIDIDGTYDGELTIDGYMWGLTDIETLSGSMTVGMNLEQK